MKKLLYFLVMIFIFYFTNFLSAHAGTLFDNFNDGTIDGWISAKACSFCNLGNWRIFNGTLMQDSGGDHYKFLINTDSLSDQTIKTKILFHDNGYAGITVWYLNENNWVDVLIYPGAHHILFLESINGELNRYYYPFITSQLNWYNMEIKASSLSGKISVYFENEHIIDHVVTTNNRVGLSGLNSGNAGGSFDDFNLYSDILIDYPTNKNECQKDNWKKFNNPPFKNQGECINFVKEK